MGYDKAETIEFKVELDGSVKIKQGNSWVAANEAKVQMTAAKIGRASCRERV